MGAPELKGTGLGVQSEVPYDTIDNVVHVSHQDPRFSVVAKIAWTPGLSRDTLANDVRSTPAAVAQNGSPSAPCQRRAADGRSVGNT
jgi:hypothetical protein